MDFIPTGSLEEQIADLRRRIFRLEEILLAHGLNVPAAQSAPVPQPAFMSAPAAAQPAATPAPPAESQLPQPAAASVPWTQSLPLNRAAASQSSAPEIEGQSLESRIGSQWFNRIGILALLIGMAWFLKFAIDNEWIGPIGRVFVGLVAGAGLIVWSEMFRSRGFTVFSYSLKAVGSGVLYLSLWASFSLYQLVPSGVAFAAMILVTAFNGLMAWMQDAELLALYAIVGAITTPVLLSTGQNHQVALFTYLLILDVAVLVLVSLRPWSRLLFAAFLGTVIMISGWWAGYYSEAQCARTAFFVFLFFLLFAFAPRLVQVAPADGAAPSGWDALAQMVLPPANAVLGFIAFYALYDRPETQWLPPWIAVLFAAFYLGMLRLPARGRLHESPAALNALHLAAAVVFLTLAIPLKAKGHWITAGWLAEGAALLWVAQRQKAQLLRGMAIGCLVLGLGALLTVHPSVSATPVFNARFCAYAFAILVFAFVTWLASRRESEDASTPAMPLLALCAALAVSLLILVAVSLEIHAYWLQQRSTYDYSTWHTSNIYAQFSYSAFFMLYGAVLLALGFSRRSSLLRWQALVLLALSIGKVFLVDMSELSQGFRILSFLGLGALLLGVSFAYQRDWLNLRGEQKQ